MSMLSAQFIGFFGILVISKKLLYNFAVIEKILVRKKLGLSVKGFPQLEMEQVVFVSHSVDQNYLAIA